MKTKPVICVWTGESFLPTLHFARLAESTFTSGQAYRLIVAEEKEKETRRTKEQNDKMWAMLNEVAEQAEHCGLRLTTDKWKVLFMDACGRESEVLPSLDRSHMVPYGGRSSHMTIAQMNELIEYMQWWGAQHGVRFASDKGITWDNAG